jgi:mRNA-degrading endonuclease RelE of RelBE toxin-antitoxin system
VTSRLHQSFRRDFAKLPRDIQQRARSAYRRFKTDPTHPGLQFKPLHSTLPLWSVRVSESYRAVGVRDGDNEIIWFFIGTHAEYDRLLATLK